MSTTEHSPTGERRALIEEVFEAALDLPPERRDAWLAARCGTDGELRHEVEELLMSLERDDGFLDAGTTPFARLADALLPSPPPHADIGPYRLLRELGRGGMGAVYLADRVDGHFRRRVAIKVLLPEVRAAALHDRLVAERQILASLSHPNIAQLLDGGVTDGGAPYLVMEYVNGVSITEHCQREKLGIPARLRLFQQVCAALHHAHRNLVLHRDIKPGNILVSIDGPVKLLDFGIAKLLDPQRDGQSVTQTESRPMTPAYASPEQMHGDPLTTASDVYALGMVLYELLTGQRAYELDGLHPHAAYHQVIEREPPRPSSRAVKHARELSGDLDAIVMMALRKEPERRYGSADLMSADIGRYLDGLPVFAHRGSASYRVSRLVRRHRVAVTTGATLVTALVLGTGIAVRQARIAERERARAADALVRSEVARRQADVVTDYLVGMFEPRDSSEGRPDVMSSAELLRRGLARAEQLVGEPIVQARMLDALSRVQLNLGDVAGGMELLKRSETIRERLLGPNDAVTTDAIQRLAELYRLTGDYAAAESSATRALLGRRASGGDASPDVAASLRQLGELAVYRSDLPRAESLSFEAVNVLRRAQGADSLLARTLQTLASVRLRRGRLQDALEALQDAERAARSAHAPPTLEHAGIGLRTAELVAVMPGRAAEGDSIARAAVAEMEAAMGPWNARTAIALYDASQVVIPRAGLLDAEGMLRRAIAIQQRLVSQGRVADVRANYGGSLTQLALLLSRQGRHAEARRLQQEGLALIEAVYGRQHTVYAGILGDGAEILRAQGELDSAEAMIRKAMAIRTRMFGEDAPLIALTSLGLARIAAARGDIRAADSIYERARATLLRYTTAENPDIRAIDSARTQLRTMRLVRSAQAPPQL